MREFREELGRTVRVVAQLGTIENRFTLQGEPGHELIVELLVEFAPGEAPDDFEPLTADEAIRTTVESTAPMRTQARVR